MPSFLGPKDAASMVRCYIRSKSYNNNVMGYFLCGDSMGIELMGIGYSWDICYGIHWISDQQWWVWKYQTKYEAYRNPPQQMLVLVENMILLSMEFSKHSWAFQNQHLLDFFCKGEQRLFLVSPICPRGNLCLLFEECPNDLEWVHVQP